MYRDEPIVQIEGFWNYYVTREGEVINSKTNRSLVFTPTMQGELTVGLMKDGRQYRRSVKVLVARAFVEGETRIFNTPILLDNNKFNVHADNIMWRPRWFAWKYTVQFEEPHPEYYEYGVVVDMDTRRRYHTIFEAAMTHGLLCQDIYRSTQNQTLVFPTGQTFSFL